MSSIGFIQLIGYTSVSILGTLLHFLYDLTDKNVVASLFSGVNESTWEHMKLLFFSMFAVAFIQHFFFENQDNFWPTKLRGILLGLILIPIMFYTYNGVIGKSPDFINISIFFISAAISFIYETKELKQNTMGGITKKSSVIILCFIALFFFFFTYVTPHLEIFKDPISGNYGL